MAYKYQYNPAATDNVSLHDTGRGRTAGCLTYRSSARSVSAVGIITTTARADILVNIS